MPLLSAKPKKIAILGGGVGAMTAAYGITSQPNWQQEYDITVYQLGWRIGGKGASGRNADFNQRIEEHGLHVWAGFYDNAFQIMQQCYAELNRPPTAPLATWQDAFKPHTYVTMMEDLPEGWTPWNIDMPTNSRVPGSDSQALTAWEYLELIYQWLIDVYTKSNHGQATALHPATVPDHTDSPGWIHRAFSEVGMTLENAWHTLEGGASTRAASGDKADDGSHPLLHWLRAAMNLFRKSSINVFDHSTTLHHALAWITTEFESECESLLANSKDNFARRLWLCLNLGCSCIRGILESGILFNGFFSVDDEEWSAWLAKYGAKPTTISSALVRGVYDYVFGYRSGDPNQPCLAAGTCLHGLIRLGLTYKGAIFYLMQAGMGDTVFTPLYQVLKNRGVKFKYFHAVRNLGLSTDKSRIDTITLGRQVTLVDPTKEYDPLVDVKGLPCWPSTPRYDQIVEGNELQSKGINLESAWADWPDRETIQLQDGVDFDLVVLGLSIGSFPYVCSELIAQSSVWQAMTSGIQTVMTQAMQLWLTPDRAGLGWTYPDTIMTAYANPQNTWGDMTHLVPREVWPSNGEPGSIAYFCGPLPDPQVIPPFSDHNYPDQELVAVRTTAIDWLNANTASLWPKAVDNSGTFNWDLLIDADNSSGPARLDSQFLRANIDPSERYVMSVPNSTMLRRTADQSGFANLYLAGDWVWTSINAGCVEAAVMAGLQASRAINGYPQTVIGPLT